MTHTTTQDKGQNQINPFAAGAVGAVVGTTVAVAAAVVLSDEKNREKVKKVVDAVREKAMEQASEMKDRVLEAKDVAEKEVKLQEKKAKKTLAAKAT